MLVSMTGFGRGESKSQNIHVTAEVRSVNNRFLDIVTRLPKSLSAYENEIKELIRGKINRGRISLTVSLQSAEIDDLDIRVDYDIASSYKSMLLDLKNRLGLSGEVELDQILKFSEIFTSIEENDGIEKLWDHTKEAILGSIEEMNLMKEQEGNNLATDLLQRLENIEKNITEIEQISKEHIPSEFESLKNRIQEIIQSPDVDSNRLETEIAILADRLDVTEECVRFRSHIDLFQDLVNNKGFAGRRLNFLTQEMNREANTIGSKCNNSDISHRVVSIKEEIERLREQVQNIESPNYKKIIQDVKLKESSIKRN